MKIISNPPEYYNYFAAIGKNVIELREKCNKPQSFHVEAFALMRSFGNI
jgi:hypothetical protein